MQSMPRPIQSARLVFPASQGGYLNLDNWRRRVWKEAFKKTEISYRPLYQMRHTYATLALAAGADVYWISRQLGHTTHPDHARPLRPVSPGRRRAQLEAAG
jgi:integrase